MLPSDVARVVCAMSSIDQQLQSALAAHEAGRFADAQRVYRAVLEQSPDHADALHFLGVLYADTNRLAESIALLRRAVERSPNAAAFHASLGNSLRMAGDEDGALRAWERAAELDPAMIEPRAGIAVLLRTRGDLARAESTWREVIRIQPAWDESHLRLGEVLIDLDRAAEAETSIRQAMQLAQQSRRDPAEMENLLGCALAKQRKFADAIPLFAAVLSRVGSNAPMLVNLGQALWECGRARDAESRFREALQLDPNFAAAHHGLSIALKSLGKLEEAESEAREAIRLAPTWGDAQHGLGNVLHERGRVPEAIAAYRQGISINPRDVDAHSSLLLVLAYEHGDAPDMLFEEHLTWARQHAEALRPTHATLPNTRDPDRRLRVGYVSPDFRDHAVSCFFEPLLAAHDRQAHHITCYANVRTEDATSARLRQQCDVWRNVAQMSEAQLATIVRADQIDILIDLAGHTAHNSLLVFARRPAPVQVSYLGYPNTTGLRTIDYLITDAVQDPPGTERFHSEKLKRLPRTMHCYRPPDPCPQIAPRPAGPIRFGSFNRLEKLSAHALEAWCDVLNAVPDSTLTIKTAALGDDATSRATADRFAARGIHRTRLQLLGRDASQGDHFAKYHSIDIALDSFPYNGTTTTCEALWMSVPVISLASGTRVSRTTAGILHAIGLPELVANSRQEFVQTATTLAADFPRLDELRRTMRQRMNQSDLCDGPGLARAIESAYRQMWRKFCG